MIAYEFKLTSTGLLPQDNGYILLSALSRKFPFLHGKKDVQIAPLRGTRTRDSRHIQIDHKSILHIRGITADQAVEISDSWVMAQGSMIHVEKSRPKELSPSDYLASRLVVLKSAVSKADFKCELATMLPEGVDYHVGNRRRSIRVKGRFYLGFSVHLKGLTPEASMQIQAGGIGKFTSMGCGVFYKGNPLSRAHGGNRP